jgi:hypothetical protein
MTLALLVQTCRYAATNFGQAKAGLPVAVSGPAAPRLVGLELPRHFACLAAALREGGSRARPFAGAQSFACGFSPQYAQDRRVPGTPTPAALTPA